MKLLANIAKVNKTARLQAIIDELEKNDIKYELQKFIGGTNLIVSIGKNSPILVIGAHYDNVTGSTGANDNASSCWILLKLIKNLKNTNKRIDFVFFDREETGWVGSNAYIDKVGARNIRAMINMDVTGFGDTIAVYDKNIIDSTAFYNLLTDNNIARHSAECVKRFGPGDDLSFSNIKIPACSICSVDEGTLNYFKGKSFYYNNKRPLVFETMHLGRLDNINSVSEEAMNRVYSFIYDGLK